MNILDIVGPVMVGPSSSHTAGAVRIGQTVGKLLGERVVNAKSGCTALFWQQGADMEQTARLWRDCWGWQWTTNGFRKASQKQKRQGFRFPLKESAL